MFHSIKNIKIIVGAIAFFSLLFFNSNGIAVNNKTSNNVLFSAANHNNLPKENYEKSQKIKYQCLIKTPRSRRKFALNETNDAFITSDKSISFYFIFSIIEVDFNNHLFQSSVSLPLQRGPPIV